MDPVVPEDEYFEWEDIMADQTARGDRDENTILQSKTLAPCTWKIESIETCQVTGVQSERARLAPSKTSHSLRATFTLDTSSLGINSAESTPTKNSPIVFPSYSELNENGTSFLIENFAAKVAHSEFAHETMDDISLSSNPSRHVDYLSHNWSEEDIWATWKRLQFKRQAPNVAERLVNATWRAWAKVRLNLKTVSPESFNWMKDLDDTWLYGPFHGKTSRTTKFTTDYSNNEHSSYPTLTGKRTRSILKRPPMSEVLLRGSEHLGKLRSKSVEVGSRPFYDETPKKRVLFREEVERYAAVQDSHLDEEKDELNYCAETYQSKYSYDFEFSNPVEDSLSTTQSLCHHLEQNIKILGNYRAPPFPTLPTDDRPPAAPLKSSHHPPESASSSRSGGKVMSSPTRPHHEPIRSSTLSEWTLFGEGFNSFDDDDDWLEPKSVLFTNWKPKIPPDEDITSQRRTSAPPPVRKPNLKLGVEADSDPNQDEMTALMRCEELYLDQPSSSFPESSTSDTSSSTSNSSGDTKRDDLSHVRVRDLEEDAGRGVMEMKQAFVDRIIDEFYRSDKEEGLQNFGLLVPPELIESAMTVG